MWSQLKTSAQYRIQNRSVRPRSEHVNSQQ